MLLDLRFFVNQHLAKSSVLYNLQKVMFGGRESSFHLQIEASVLPSSDTRSHIPRRSGRSLFLNKVNNRVRKLFALALVRARTDLVQLKWISNLIAMFSIRNTEARKPFSCLF